MDQAIATACMLLFLIVVLALSYVRHRHGKDDAKTRSVSATMREMRAYYFDEKAGSSGKNVARAFDVEPLEIVARTLGETPRKSTKTASRTTGK